MKCFIIIITPFSSNKNIIKKAVNFNNNCMKDRLLIDNQELINFISNKK